MLDSGKLKELLTKVQSYNIKYQNNVGLLDLNKKFIATIENLIENLDKKSSGIFNRYLYDTYYESFNETLNELIELKGK